MKFLVPFILLSSLLCRVSQAHAHFEKMPAVKISIVTPGMDTCITIKLFNDYYRKQGDKIAKSFYACTSGSKCEFVIPVSNPAYFSLRGTNNDILSKFYYIQPGDSIIISVDSATTFTGKGAKKIELQYKLYNLSMNKFVLGDPRYASLLSSYQWKLWALHKTDSLFQIRQSLIQSYTSSTPANVLQQISLDVMADLYTPLYEKTYSYLSKPVDSIFIHEAKAYADAFENKPFQVSPFAHNSRSFPQLLISKLRSDLFIRSFLTYGKKTQVSLAQLIAEIEQHFSGILEEKLITTALMEWFDKDEDAPTSLKKYLPKVSKPYQKVLQQLSDVKMPGSPVKNFYFIDQLGDTVTLHKFKGKAVVVTFWTAYCHHCKVLGLRMKELKPQIKALGDVELVFISVDQNKSKWLADIAQNTFTQIDNTNLNTGTLGYNHPLLKTYDYKGMPSQMIIDRYGRLVIARPTRPLTPSDTAQFLKQVKAALNSK